MPAYALDIGLSPEITMDQVATLPTRATNGRFIPGWSGNPGGRPRVLGDLQAVAREHTEEALQTLLEVMRDPHAPAAARVQAANSMLDRAYGRPPQAIQVGNPQGEGGEAARTREFMLAFARAEVAAEAALARSKANAIVAIRDYAEILAEEP